MPKPCCLPDKFSATEFDMGQMRWAEVSVDFTRRKKVILYPGHHDFIYFDIARDKTYKQTNHDCWISETDAMDEVFQCIPEDAEITFGDSSFFRNLMPISTWTFTEGNVKVEMTVTNENCYPISATYTDTVYGLVRSILTFSNLKENVDPLAFDIDLSNCEHRL
ncbi:uncharacterized protein LOC106011765 [Aplysia californica]|uniref:Uncharacterized protein LOC106011765 n=1 Tax=Aplysia californica TaxID=6500 RepID=A0ABM0ZZV3_APLCA|nr:uncharacterized protein LOC106011765 [Aplysia californica]